MEMEKWPLHKQKSLSLDSSSNFGKIATIAGLSLIFTGGCRKTHTLEEAQEFIRNGHQSGQSGKVIPAISNPGSVSSPVIASPARDTHPAASVVPLQTTLQPAEYQSEKKPNGSKSKPDGSFRFSTFSVPDDGELVEKNERGDDRKSVVYILDYHNNSATVGDYQRRVQTEIFEIVEDLVGSYGRVPLAMEVWKIGDTAGNYEFKTSDSDLLETLFSRSTMDERLAMVPAVMRDTKFAGPVITGTFRDSVIPIGTVTEEERRGANELVRMENRLLKATIGGEGVCTGTDGRNYTFFQARDSFRGDGSETTDHCYCAVSVFEGRFLEKFRTRMTEVPVKEVRAALNADGNFAVVIAGLKHWPAAKAELERREVNYVAVAPKTLAPGVEEKLKSEKIDPFYPDSPDGKCDKLMRERRALVEAALGRI